jgi:hypothetical protein
MFDYLKTSMPVEETGAAVISAAMDTNETRLMRTCQMRYQFVNVKTIPVTTILLEEI